MTMLNNNITSFGRLLRQLRERKGDSLRDLATKLDISAAFLSAMEIGKKKIPNDYACRIAEIYNLNSEELKELEDSITITNKKVMLDLDNMTDDQVEASLIFARKIKDADSDLLDKLMKALKDEN